jgi:hypothetical protein
VPTTIVDAAAGRTVAPPTPTGSSAAAAPCSNGQLTVGDLPEIDALWRDGLSEADARAAVWQDDAMLTTFRVSCELFETGFRWQAVYYSRDAQAFFSSDTRETEPAGIDPDSVPALDTANLSFALVHDALVRAGVEDATAISASTGVDVRMNTERSPFGPSQAPKETIIYHLAIDRLGETIDLFIEGEDGAIFRYAD